MHEYLEKVNSIYKVLLRGCETYEDFLKVLSDLNAPREYDAFFIFFIKSVYVDDDFYALIALIGEHKREFNGLTPAKVLEEISKEVFTDYIKN